MFLLEAPGKNRFPGLSQLLEAFRMPWRVACSPSAKPARAAFSCCVPLAQTLLSPLISGDPCDDIGITHLPISRSLRSHQQSPLLHVRPCLHWFWSSSRGHLWGPVFCPPLIPGGRQGLPRGALSGDLLTPQSDPPKALTSVACL